MKYSEVVHDLAACGAVWHFYDTQFHLLRQSNAVEFPWGSTHWELWIRAQHFNNARFSKVQVPVCNNLSSGRPLVPKGFCCKFHRGKDCLGCNFKHQCFKCGVIHPALRCNFHPKQSTPCTLLTSILYSGFPLHFWGVCVSFFANNLISDQQNPEIVSAKISKELAACQLAGPFDRPPFPNFRVSPLGVVPKKAPVEYRLIHHLSFPCGASVNDR